MISPPEKPSTLTLTGEVVPNRFVILLDQQRAALPESRFQALLVLVDAASRTAQGRAGQPDFAAHGVAFNKNNLHQLIRRLRRDFSEAFGGGIGQGLIRHCGWSSYRLALDPESIVVRDDFLDLESLLPRSLFLRIQRLAAAPAT